MSAKDRVDEDWSDDDEAEEDTQEGKYLTFGLNEESYGIEISCITEIIGMQTINAVPDMPGYIRGVINLRGKIIPVMDVRLRFGMPERQYDERTCIIVIRVKNQSIGLIVDRVSEVLYIPVSEIEPTPELRKGRRNRFVKGLGKVGDEVKMLLETEHMLVEDENDLTGRDTKCLET